MGQFNSERTASWGKKKRSWCSADKLNTPRPNTWVRVFVLVDVVILVTKELYIISKENECVADVTSNWTVCHYNPRNLVTLHIELKS
jgi:hypothetical protein